jgi:biotin carboxylase
VPTTRDFLLELVADPDVQHGRIDTGWIERSMAGRAAG